jgi:ABC-type uncharacterized transport system ATPase component
MKLVIVKQEEGNVQHLTVADQLVIAQNQKKHYGLRFTWLKQWQRVPM